MKILSPITEDKDIATKKYVLDNAGGVTVNNISANNGNITLNATNIAISDANNNFTTDTVQGAIDQLFQFANSGKQDVADSIGYTGTYSGTFATLAGHIDTTKTKLAQFLPNAEQTVSATDKVDDLANKLPNVRYFQKRTKLRKANASTETIILNKSIAKEDIIVTPLRLNGDNLISPSVFQADFDNGDDGDFLTNTNISFANNRAEIPVVSRSANFVIGTPNEVVLDLTQFDDFRVTDITDTTLSYETIATAQILVAKDNIPIQSVGDFTKVKIVYGNERFSIPGSVSLWYGVKYAMTFDSGTTWHGVQNDQFVQISNINDTTEFYDKGIFAYDSLNYLYEDNEISQAKKAQLETLRNGSNTLKFAYYIRRYNFSRTTYTDTLTLSGRLIGTLEPANESVSVSFNEGTKTITCTFNAEDTYQLNWMDT